MESVQPAKVAASATVARTTAIAFLMFRSSVSIYPVPIHFVPILPLMKWPVKRFRNFFALRPGSEEGDEGKEAEQGEPKPVGVLQRVRFPRGGAGQPAGSAASGEARRAVRGRGTLQIRPACFRKSRERVAGGGDAMRIPAAGGPEKRRA